MNKIKSVLSVLVALTTLTAQSAFALGVEVTPPANIGNTVTTPPVNTPPVNTAPIIPSDTTAPVIFDIAQVSVSPTDASFVWSTDELANSTLEYGLTTGYGSAVTLGTSALLVHTATLLGLTAGTTYYYCIHATDLSTNTSSSCSSFMTAAAPVLVDTTPPAVTSVTITLLTSTSAVITWNTNEVSNSQVQYGLTTGYGLTSDYNSGLTLIHSATITGLTPNTEYHYRVNSWDEIGNVSYDFDNIFTTEMAAAPAPAPSAPVSEPAPANTGSGVLTPTNPTTPTNTPAPVPVPSGGSSGGSGTPAPTLLPAPASTNTPAPVVLVAVISGVETQSINTTGVTIAWTTDLPSDSQIEYGDSENFGLSTTLDTNLATSHSVMLTGLSPATDYIYRVKSKPTGAAVATVSANYELNTLDIPTAIVPAANITSVASGNIISSGATITWTTDKGATSQVEYGISTAYGETSAPDTSLVTSHSVTLANLRPNTAYHFRAKSVDNASNITYSEDYIFNSIVNPGQALAAIVPPAAVTNLSVLGQDSSSVTLGWQAASASADVEQIYEVRYSTQPITPSSYDSALSAQTTPIYTADLDQQGTVRRYSIVGLDPATRYYFTVKSQYTGTDFSALSNTVTALIAPAPAPAPAASASNAQGSGAASAPAISAGGGGYTPVEPVEPPLLIKAEPAESQIVFTWQNPGQASFVRTVIIRKEGGYPASPTDGAKLYDGRAQEFTDTNTPNGKAYYYAFYAYDHHHYFSLPVHISLAASAANKEVVFNENGFVEPRVPKEHFVTTLQKGQKDIEVEHLQEVLAADESLYPEKLITGYFGGLTERALKKFQIKNHLPATGIVDVATQKELNAVAKAEVKLDVPAELALFEHDLKLGDSGPNVEALQQFLVREGSLSGTLISGSFGASTRKAVIVFQKAHGVSPAIGYVGPRTRHKIRDLTGF